MLEIIEHIKTCTGRSEQHVITRLCQGVRCDHGRLHIFCRYGIDTTLQDFIYLRRILSDEHHGTAVFDNSICQFGKISTLGNAASNEDVLAG